MITFFVKAIVGMALGWIHTWIAVKMLFWPRRPWIVFGKKLPFTPGLFVARKDDFARAIAVLVDRYFVEGGELYRLVQKAEDDGLLMKAIGQMGKPFVLAFRLYVGGRTPEDFKRECDELAKVLRDGGVVRHVVEAKISGLATREIEDLVLSVVHRELRAIVWMGALLGGLIAVCQSLVP